MRDKQKERKKELHNNDVDKPKRGKNEEKENVYLIPRKLNLTDI